MKKFNDIKKFTFLFAGLGHYDVTYTTGRGDYYNTISDDNHIIDSTKNTSSPKAKHIVALRNLVKRTGKHYHKSGKPF